jgi:hypothetical protein
VVQEVRCEGRWHSGPMTSGRTIRAAVRRTAASASLRSTDEDIGGNRTATPHEQSSERAAPSTRTQRRSTCIVTQRPAAVRASLDTTANN